MAKSRQQKEDIVNSLAEKIKDAKSGVVSSYRGLDVKSTEDLRSKCRDEELEIFSIKQTLLSIALEKAGYADFNLDGADGIVTITLGYQDEVAPSRVLYDFSKAHEALKLHNGILEGQAIEQEVVMNLAQLPSKDELLAKAVGSMKAPINGFAGVLSGTLRGFVQVLNQIQEQKS